MSIIEWKTSHPLSSNLISSIQFLWVAFNNITAVFGYFVLLTAIQPFKIIDRTKYDYYERWLFSCQFKFCSSWGFENGWTVRQYGDFEKLNDLTDRFCILVANHQNTCDISILMYGMALIRPLNGAMNWVMDAILKFCSFGWVSYAHNDFFIWQSQDAKKFKWIAPASADDIRDIEIKRFGQYVKKYFNCTSWRKRRWLTIFPEGGFKYKRVHNSKKFAQKNNLTELEYCTYPRHYGIHAAIQNGAFEYILDATIAYSNERDANLISWWFGAAQTVSVYWRVIEIRKGLSEDQFRDELFKIWTEKEELLKNFSQYGHFPKKPNNNCENK